MRSGSSIGLLSGSCIDLMYIDGLSATKSSEVLSTHLLSLECTNQSHEYSIDKLVHSHSPYLHCSTLITPCPECATSAMMINHRNYICTKSSWSKYVWLWNCLCICRFTAVNFLTPKSQKHKHTYSIFNCMGFLLVVISKCNHFCCSVILAIPRIFFHLKCKQFNSLRPSDTHTHIYIYIYIYTCL